MDDITIKINITCFKEMVIMKIYFLFILPLALLSCGCAGREGNPVPIYQQGDENLSCEELQVEIVQLQANMEKILPVTNKETSNMIYSLTLPVFMDLKQGEKMEYDAMRRRHNRLLKFAEKKECIGKDNFQIKSTPH